MKTVKKALCALLCLILLAGTAGCFGGKRQTGGDEKYDDIDPNIKLSLTFKHMWPEHEDVVKSLIAGFNKKFPNVTVTPSVTPYTQILQVLQASYISGELPNVYVYFTHYMTPMVSASDGVMAGTLNSLRNDIIGDFIQPDAWELGNIKGKYYSVPLRANGMVVFYNKTLFAEKGWTKPDTFQDFEALLKVISRTTGLTPLAAGGRDAQITYLTNALGLFTGILDGSVEEPGYAVSRLKPDDVDTDDTAVLIYEKIRKWYEADFFGKNAIAVSATGSTMEFTGRRAAMVFASNNGIGDIAPLMPNDEIGVFAIPAPAVISDTVKYAYGGYEGLSYNPTASEDHIKVSLQFIKYLAGKEAQQIMADRAQSVIVNKDVVYHSATLQAFANELKYVGAYTMGSDYITGTHSAGNEGIVSMYIAGLSTLSAKQVIRQINDNVYADMQDPLINDPTVDWYPRQNEKKSFDRAWLYTNLDG